LRCREKERMIDSKKMPSEDGFDLRLVIDHDPWGSLADFDGYTEKQMKAWNEDEWFFVTAEVIASRAGIDLGSGCYGSIEYGYYTYTDDQDNFLSAKVITIEEVIEMVGPELAEVAIEHAKAKLDELMKVETNA
jgi:hypothetical protein